MIDSITNWKHHVCSICFRKTSNLTLNFDFRWLLNQILSPLSNPKHSNLTKSQKEGKNRNKWSYLTHLQPPNVSSELRHRRKPSGLPESMRNRERGSQRDQERQRKYEKLTKEEKFSSKNVVKAKAFTFSRRRPPWAHRKSEETVEGSVEYEENKQEEEEHAAHSISRV